MDLINPIVRRWLQDGKADPDEFWARAARQLPWFRPWDRAFSWEPPTFRWFEGGLTNLSFNALDYHVQNGRAGQAALVYANERGERRLFTYAQLRHEVVRVAAALRRLGIGKGDRITIYMPTSPEAILLMLAAVRIGAIHMVVFAGFGERALGDRIRASGSRLVFATNITYRKGKDVRLKEIVDASLEGEPHDVEHVVVLNRGAEPAPMREGRDLLWEDFLSRGTGQSGAHIPVESNEPAFILATSGTTAKPKLAVHTQGGYQVHVASMGKWCFGLRAGEVWWSTSDIGWIVGHSYIVYAPLLAGATTLAYEGSIDHPAPDAVWKIVEEFGVTGLFTSPTAVRLLMRYGEEPARGCDISTLERVFCAGEVLNPPAWDWLQNRLLRGRVPVIDHMWQTETSGPVFGNPYGLSLLPIKPGSATVPLPGIDSAVIGSDGLECAPGEKGIMVLRRPFPGLTASLWGERERYGADYWDKIPGVYYTGDSAHVDADGYVWFAGRADEIIKIASHRLGTIEVETACLQHEAVAEAGVTGRPDELRGEVISAFVVLKQGRVPSPAMRQEILDTIRRELGAVAVIGDLNFVHSLPKTRSGKIMRRVLKAVTLDRDPGDITTIEDEGSVEEARLAWEEMKGSMRG
ncbi:MAG: acetate--CoA ligase [Acidobacteriota bacterium]|nr:acetate--CoA ligase [Acidobacteriota bacterium]